MIARIWHGYTRHENADTYEKLLRTEIFEGIASRQMSGFRGIELLRRERPDEIEFVTLMWFDSLDDVRTFAGPDLEVAVVPPSARKLLAHFDERSAHYEVRKPREG
jgi:heme-degrading monooxygenase HmoA